ncbi:MAG TPA: hypothetical protein GXX75_24685 [Clostridiales bacterium]|nr:hypothetical protein [Clostridiales bacterium]
MKGLERINNAIAGRKVDKTPIWPFVMAFSAKYAKVIYREFATDYKSLAKAQIITADAFGLDAVTVDSDAYREASACGAILDFPEDGLPVIVKHAITDKTKFAFKMPDISKSPRLIDKVEGIRYLKNHYKDEKAVVGWIESPLQSAAMLYDINEFMVDLFEEPEFVEELLEFASEIGIAFALEQAKAGADIIGIGDATASMISPNLYETIVYPYTKKVVDGIRKKSDVKLKYHICGDAKHILPYAKELQFDLVNIDYKIDAREAFDLVGDSICIKGNIDPVGILKDGTPELIRQEVLKLKSLNKAKFILSAGCEVARDTPIENMKAFVE